MTETPVRPYIENVDMTKPHVIRVTRADGVKEWTFSTSFVTHPENAEPEDVHTTAIGAAQAAAARVRIEHSYHGASQVAVWQLRDGDHYRTPTPACAQRFDFPAQPELAPKPPVLTAVEDDDA